VMTLAVVILLLIFPIVMILNVKSFSVPPPFQLRVGKSLQVQHWLAIIGVEFSTLFGTFLLPKLSSILVSKYVTKRLMGSGLELSTLLNTQQSAPFPTQFRHGMKRLLGIRLVLPIFGVVLSIAYKFSFENVSIEDTIQISNVALVEAGDLSVQFDAPTQFTTNLLDLLGLGDETSIVFQNSTQIFLVGPALGLSATNSLLRGVLQTCHPHYYDRFAFSSSPTPSTEQIGNNSIRVQDSSGSSTVVDISFAADGSLAAGLGQLNPTSDSTKTAIYTEFVTVVRAICVGYVSWSRSDLYPIFNSKIPKTSTAPKQPFIRWRGNHLLSATLYLHSWDPRFQMLSKLVDKLME
jgi:hypothetical protein